MSFYGSVYYQLIDTFYKIIVKNSGNKNYTFNDNLINPSETPTKDIIESPAVGRKGVFSLDSGNYWINFSKNDEANESAPYTIWHSAPHNDEETRHPISSWRLETDQYEVLENEKGEEIEVKRDGVVVSADNGDFVQLQDHDFIRIVETNYDEAGHVIGDTTQEVIYRLPKTNISTRLDYLEKLVGEPSEEYPLPRWDKDTPMPEDQTQDGTNSIMTITDYAEKNYEDIKQLEKYVGQWNKMTEFWGESFHVSPTIADFIGNVDILYNADGLDDYVEFQRWFTPIVNEEGETVGRTLNLTLSKLIGSLPPMWAAISENGSNQTPISISEAIISLKARLESINTALTAQNSITQLALDGVAERVKKIEETDLPEIYGDIDDLINEDLAIYQALADEEDARSKADQALQGNIDKEAESRAAEDAKLYAKIAEEKAALQSKIDADDTALYSKITSEYLAKDAELNSSLSSIISTNYTSLDGKIDGVQNQHTLNNDALVNRATALEKTLGIGDSPNADNVLDRITAIESNIGSIGSDTNVAAEISNIKAGIGSSTDDENVGTVYGAIAKNASAIAAANGEINNRLTISQAANAYYPLSSGNSLKTDFDALATDFGALVTAIGDISSNEKLEGQDVASLLAEILTSIEGINKQIEDINFRIDELHGEVESGTPETTE